MSVSRISVVKFKSKEYQPVKKIRLDNSISNAIIIKGA